MSINLENGLPFLLVSLSVLLIGAATMIYYCISLGEKTPK